MENIRAVNEKDLKKLMHIEKIVFKKEAFSKWLMKKLIKYNLFFSILHEMENENEIIGYVIVIKQNINEANLINIAIKPEEQNKKFGTQLLEYTIKKLKSLEDIKKVYLNVKIGNKALYLYEKFNFKVIRTIESYYMGGEDAFLMELTLP